MSASFFENPYPYYAHLREHEPLHRTKQGCLLITRHQDILDALKHPDLGSAPADFASTHPRQRERHTSANVSANLLPFNDGEPYVRLRQFLGPVLRKTFQENPPDIGGVVARHLDVVLQRRSFDVLQDFGTPLSLEIACDFVGLDHERQHDLKRWTDAFFRLFAALPGGVELSQINRELDAFRAHVRGLIDLRRKKPCGDLISRLVQAAIGEDRLGDEELADNIMLIFADAIENVDAAIASAVLALHRHPSVLRRVRSNPGLVPAMVEEALRYDAPGQTAVRIVRRDTAIAGDFARRNEVVLLGLGSANRDPDAFHRPDEFRLDRPKQDHLSFGRGNHSCLGFFLVRAEMCAALGALLASTRKIAVDDGNLSWQHRPGHRWLSRLDVVASPN